MKTTIDVADALLREAKRLAARRGITLKELVEDSLRAQLERERARPPAEAVHTHTFRGDGLQPGHSWDDWGTIRNSSYEGRGG